MASPEASPLAVSDTDRFLLRAAHVVDVVLQDWKPDSMTEFQVHQACSGVENAREVLSQIHINPEHPEHARAVDFCVTCLLVLRGRLSGWDVEPLLKDVMISLPMPEMPFSEENNVWTITHPCRRIFFEDVQAAKGFVRIRMAEVEPWVWIDNFLKVI